MNDYIESNTYTIFNLLADAKIPMIDSDTIIFEDITLNVMLGMYCSPGLKFAAKEFKEDLEKCSIKTLNALKMYKSLQNLSKLATNYNNLKIAASVANTPLSASAKTPNSDLTEENQIDIDDDLGTISIDLRNTMQELVVLPTNAIDNVDEQSQLEGEDYMSYLVRTEINKKNSITITRSV